MISSSQDPYFHFSWDCISGSIAPPGAMLGTSSMLTQREEHHLPNHAHHIPSLPGVPWRSVIQAAGRTADRVEMHMETRSQILQQHIGARENSQQKQPHTTILLSPQCWWHARSRREHRDLGLLSSAGEAAIRPTLWATPGYGEGCFRPCSSPECRRREATFSPLTLPGCTFQAGCLPQARVCPSMDAGVQLVE